MRNEGNSEPLSEEWTMTYALRTLGLLASLIATACELPTEPETRASAERETRSSPQRPTAVTLSATSVTQSGARINGRVNPNGSATTWSIEYGTTTGLGQVCNGPAPLNGTTPVNVWCTFDGAPAGATRYYRVVASNGAGRSTGEIVQFTTLSGNTGNTPDQNLVALLTASSFWFDRTGAYGRTFRFTTANATGGWNGTGTYIRCLAVNCGGTSVQFGFAWRLDGNRLRVYNNVGDAVDLNFVVQGYVSGRRVLRLTEAGFTREWIGCGSAEMPWVISAGCAKMAP
jgi:hypothetical protein